jgi:hypothetical protein
MIENEENLTEYEIKKLISIEKRIKIIAKEISDLGFNVAIHDGSLSILKGETHTNEKTNYENIKTTITVGDWSGVDW